MDRSLRQRILKAEKLLSTAEAVVSASLKKRAEHNAQLEQTLRPKALLHATAVAAIVMSGAPKINEPLVRAWERTLRHHRITIKNEYGRELEFQQRHEDQDEEYEFALEYWCERGLLAAHELYPLIMQGANETERFTKIFQTAPIWLLEFTWMRLDASVLKFELPRMSDKQVWGEEGLKDFLRWPLLPLGMMTDGNLLPEVPLEEGAPADVEAYRQHRRIDEFLARPGSMTHESAFVNTPRKYY
jgi:hypothetical protein